MIEMPDFKKDFEWENSFYLSCDITRIGKMLAHYELFKMVQNVPGAICECGVFKGASLARFAAFRDIFGNPFSKKVIGFDIFGTFPETAFPPDREKREDFIQSAGDQSTGAGLLQRERPSRSVCQAVASTVECAPPPKSISVR